MQYVGIDGCIRHAAWCARSDGGAITGDGVVPADEDRLVKLVLAYGTDVTACVAMMSGAVWVRDRLAAPGRSRCPTSGARHRHTGWPNPG
jgi:hypothetical protein